MSLDKTYAVGAFGSAIRVENHDSNTLVDISLNSLIGSSNPLSTNPKHAFISQGMVNNYHLVDVMTDPDDPNKLCAIAGNRPELYPTIQNLEGYAGIFMSHDGGATWFFPQGDWVTLCSASDEYIVKYHHEVWYADSNTIYIISEAGYIFKSIDGGLNFNSIKDNTGGNIRVGNGDYTSCIHMWKDDLGINGGKDYGVVCEIEDYSIAHSNLFVWKTLDGGVTWTKLNSGNPLENTILSNFTLGYPGGIYISQDQSYIAVQSHYGVNRSLDSGATFTTTLDANRNALHLTWYDSYNPFVDRLWVTGIGIAGNHVYYSIDGAQTWTSVAPGGVTYGAHFYTGVDGYLTSGSNILSTAQQGQNPTPFITNPNGEYSFYAIWTGSAQSIYRLEDCSGLNADVYVTDFPNGTILFPFVTSGVSIKIENHASISAAICWRVYVETNPVSNIEIIDALNTIQIWDTCQGCLPPPPISVCWKLELCPHSTGISCQTIYYHTGFDWTPWLNQWIYINGDTTCVYKPVRVMQAAFMAPDSYSTLCALVTPWANPIEYKVESLIYNGAQYITTVSSYIMDDVNYDPVECAAFICTSVACGTTENSYANVADHINSIIGAVGLNNELEAFPSDTTLTPYITVSDTSFKVQYDDGDTFTIILSKTVAGLTTYYTYDVATGNVITVATGSSINISKIVVFAGVVTNDLCSNTTIFPLINPDIGIVPAECEEDPCALVATYSGTNVTVNGGSDGTIDLTISGQSSSGVSIVWSTGAVNVTSLTGLSAGIYTVTITDLGWDDGSCEVELLIIITEPPLPPIIDEACDLSPRLGEPGFSVKNCDPKTVIKIKSKFADSVYALFKRMRYGVETCCEFDLDKIDIKHQLLELGEMNDPDACICLCDKYSITGTPGFVSQVQYIDCFGCTLEFELDPDVPVEKCAKPDSIISLDNPIVVTYMEKCCDAVPVTMVSYCVTLLIPNTTLLITWENYRCVTVSKTLTNVVDSCGETGISSLCVCAVEGSVNSSEGRFTLITKLGPCNLGLTC